MALSFLHPSTLSLRGFCSPALPSQSSGPCTKLAAERNSASIASLTKCMQGTRHSKGLRTRRSNNFIVKASDESGGGEKTTIERVVETAVKTTRQGISTATGFVPASVPRPVATAGVGVVGLLVLSTVLKSLFSTLLFFVVAGGLGYAAFVYLTQTGGTPGGGGGGGGKGLNPIDQARKIMDKYK